jgi:hypothetical protein
MVEILFCLAFAYLLWVAYRMAKDHDRRRR